MPYFKSPKVVNTREVKNFVPCRICISSQRYLIEGAWRNRPERDETGEIRKAIAKRYKKIIGFKSNDAFIRYIQKHFQNPHYSESLKIVNLGTPKSTVRKEKATLKSLSDALLTLGQEQVEYYFEHPEEGREKVGMGDIIRAQDAISKRMQVEVNRSSMHIAMAKLFGGFANEVDAEVLAETYDTERDVTKLFSENTE